LPVEPIPFNASQDSGLEQLAGASPSSINSLVDETGTVRARPGIVAWSDFPSSYNASPVTSMAAWGDRLIWATEDRKWFAWLGPGLTVDLSDSTATTKIAGSLRPQILATRNRVIAVAGNEPQKWGGAGLSARLGGSPPFSAALAAIATRVVLMPSDDSGTIRWSGLGDTAHETWDALNFAEAEARPDTLVNVADNTNELFAFGKETTQVFVPDPVVGFATGRALNIGMLVRDSLVKVDDEFAFLDRERRIVQTDGRAWQDIAPGLGKTLGQISTVSDCWGFRTTMDQVDICTWMFPTHGKGYILQRGANRWSEWRAFNSNGWAAPTITAALNWPEKNLTLVGLSTGQIAKLDLGTYTDLGNVLKVELVTGYVDNGTKARKHCKSALFRFKRGQTAQGGTAPRVAISWRDDLGAWKGPIFRTLGIAGDYNPIVQLRSLGVYRQRQWKLEFDANAELSFAGAEHEFEVLAN